MANFLKISHKILKEMDFSLKNSIFISKKSGKLIKMQQFNQIFNFLFFVPNFLQKNKKFIKSKKQKFFVFVGSHKPEQTEKGPSIYDATHLGGGGIWQKVTLFHKPIS